LRLDGLDSCWSASGIRAFQPICDVASDQRSVTIAAQAGGGMLTPDALDLPIPSGQIALAFAAAMAEPLV
jgi:hypothetical protein